MASKLSNFPADHVLIGTWVTDEEDFNAAFTFAVTNKKLQVSGFCQSDGEEFEISDLKWNGGTLSFMARMPSTNWLSKNVFTVRPDGRLDLELTTYEVWKKKDVTRGEVPAAWRRPSKGKRDVRETISSVTHYRSE